MTISVIVPMYHGKKYLNDITNQIDKCAQNIGRVNVELILYNDSPDEEIVVNENNYPYMIRVFNPGFNSGIHGARVHGLEYAIGEYVLFLDQDDKIAPTYLLQQLKCIGSADAVVCRAIHNNRLHYTDTHVFEEVISKEFMIQKWCPIVSPGQVLIRKSSIPQHWKNNIIIHNGADDYFLWLLMMSEKRIFSLNQEVLFEHVSTGLNTSDDTNNMMDSEMEMIHLLKNCHVFSSEDEVLLSRLPDSLRRIHIKELDNCKRAFLFLQQWNKKLSNGLSPLLFFREKNIRKVAIYGAGDLGRNIEMLFKNTEIKVCFYIDRNAEYIISDLPVYKMENILGKVDAVISTIKSDIVKRELQKKLDCPIYEAEEILI